MQLSAPNPLPPIEPHHQQQQTNRASGHLAIDSALQPPTALPTNELALFIIQTLPPATETWERSGSGTNSESSSTGSSGLDENTEQDLVVNGDVSDGNVHMEFGDDEHVDGKLHHTNTQDLSYSHCVPVPTAHDVDTGISACVKKILGQDVAWLKFSKLKSDPTNFSAMLMKYKFVQHYINKLVGSCVAQDLQGAPHHTIEPVSAHYHIFVKSN